MSITLPGISSQNRNVGGESYSRARSATGPAVGSRAMHREPTNALVPRGLEGRRTLPATLTLATGKRHTPETIIRAWLGNKSDNTIRAYQRDLEAFAQFLSLSLAIRPGLTVYAALDKLFRQAAPSGHEIVLAYRDFLNRATLSSGTINRHLATLRSLSRLARMLGVATWAIEVSGLPPERRRKTAGPSLDVVQAMLTKTSGDSE